NDPADQTDLHWADRIGDATFRYRGLIRGANSPSLDGVPTVSANNRFCFVSTREYLGTLASVFCGTWNGTDVTGATAQRDLSAHIPGRLIFDTEISADGQTLIYADGLFRGGPAPVRADLHVATWSAGSFQLSPGDDRLVAALNTDALEYAPALSADGLTI